MKIISSKTTRTRLLISFFIAAAISTGELFSQQIPVRRYTVADGLPENKVINIFEDSYGFLWLRSTKGTTRFDGREMITYSNPADFPGARIHSVFEDRNRNIYGLTVDGLARYGGQEFRLIQLPADRSYAKLSYKRAVDNNNIIWINAIDTTGNNLLVRFDGEDYSEVRINHDNFLKGDVKRIISCDDSDDLLLRVNNHIYTWYKERLKDIAEMEARSIRNTSKGLVLIDEENNCFSFEDGALKPLETGKRTDGFIEPLVRLNSSHDSIAISDLENKYVFHWPYGQVYRIQACSKGTMWITSENGLYKILSTSLTCFDSYDKLPQDVWSISEDAKGNIWFGSFNGTLHKYDGRTIEDMTGLLPVQVNNFTLGSRKLSSGEMWLTTFNGIIKYDGESFIKSDITKEQVEYIYEDTVNGDILMSSMEGLVILSDGMVRKFPDSSPGRIGYIRAITRDTMGLYRLATEYSIYNFDGRNFKELPQASQMSVSWNATVTDSRGCTWFGGDNGLYRYNINEDSLIPALPEAQNEAVRFLKPIPGGRMIVGRIKDFLILDTSGEESEEAAYRVFNSSNGFTGIGCLQNGVMVDQSGYAWILSYDQVFRLNLDSLDQSPPPPLIYIEAIDVYDGKEWHRTARYSPYDEEPLPSLSLGHGENSVGIDLHTLDLHHLSTIKYSYKFEGRNNTWSEPATNDNFIFTSLKPGTYKLSFRAECVNHQWTGEAVSLQLVVRPAYWQTTLFKVSAIIAILLAGIYAGTFVTKARQRKKEKEAGIIRDYYRLQMGRFVQQFDPHFTFNILSSLVSFIELGDQDRATKYIFKFSELLRIMLQDNNFVRPLTDEIDFITGYCELQKIQMEEKLQVTTDIRSQETLSVKIPRMMVHNFVDNAIKWGLKPRAGGGRIDIIIDRQGDYHIITVEDNGIGRAAAGKKKIKGSSIGLSVTRQLIDMLNRVNRKKMQLIIEDLHDSEGKASGTRVVLKIPERYNMLEKD